MSVGKNPEPRGFWRDLVSTVAFFSPALNPLQRYVGISSKEILAIIGEEMGRETSSKFSQLDLKGLLSQMSETWHILGLGRFEVVGENPLTIRISNCTICGQIPELGRTFECSFHEGFIRGLLSHHLRKQVKVRQEGSTEGESGTWTRTYSTDISLSPLNL
ncbi:MAG: hypothetical protein QXV62_08805 [Nitrososphaerota archaeon]